MKHLEETHDLMLSDWGPYTKKYIGLSHIADKDKGFRFDLSAFPGFYRRKVDIPNVKWESGYHPWEASTNLDYYSYRHELEWKDQVYTDISYSRIDDSSRLIRVECVNNTPNYQDLVIHFMASMNFPSSQCAKVELPGEAIWIDALDYSDIESSVKYPTENLMPDGLYRGEIRDDKFINGSGLGRGFGGNIGDRIFYKVSLETSIDNAVVIIRYRVPGGNTAKFLFEGINDESIFLEGKCDFTTLSLSIGDLHKGEHCFKLTSMTSEPIEFDGFVIVSSDKASDVKFTTVKYNSTPEIITGPHENSMILKYGDVDNYYGIAWMHEDFEIREFLCSELDSLMRFFVHNHVSSQFQGDGEGHFTNVFMRPISIAPNSTKAIYAAVCSGSREMVESYIIKHNEITEAFEDIYTLERNKAIDFSLLKSYECNKYISSQIRMAATTLTNVVYPTYCKRAYIKHYTPGRWWDSLYTWDSGFIGLGLLELDVDRAIECLNAYVTEPGDKNTAFIHHGSPVPVQFYLYQELWNKTQSKELLEFFYPRLRQYYEFLSGKLGSSTIRGLKSNLLKTWDYFYNSGGWDDYPPQQYVHSKGLEKYVAPVINTAQCILSAKVLIMAANKMGLSRDIAEYEEDITILTEALQKYSWDEESGYFGYVCHDEKGNPTGLLKYEDGSNYNMGLDGIYPLIAGICSTVQEERIVNNILAEDKLWTSIGISTVDQSATYYRKDGYWNGAVWMPHQWFVWKTMLDLGKPEIAFKIAETGLKVWKGEVDTSYNCFEHFIVQSGRGAGWHQFGGLSTPVMSWFGAYYRPGRLSTGFKVWVEEQKFLEDNTLMNATLKIYGKTESQLSIIVTMNPEFDYESFWNGRLIKSLKLPGGSMDVYLPCDTQGDLTVRIKD
jgi:hypothetical protein